ncbi:MAG: DUF3854 domain-containing protein [Thermodesulfobacteriota bacterium]|nr:DUF3854 domain-containing protein [Thermodesulfobacteriota bacterium]
MKKNKKIFDDHLKDLEGSGISLETANSAGIYSMETQKLVCEYGFPLPIKTNGMVFPYNNGFSRAKLFPPLKTEKGTMKYAQPKNSPARLYIPTQQVQMILSDPSKDLNITEGEKKVLKAIQEGLLCIGIGGLWSWMQDGKPSKYLDKIIWFGRKVRFIPDSDAWTRYDLLQAIYAFCSELQDRGADVKIITLPHSGSGKVGLDDYLLEHSVEDLQKLSCITLTHKGFKKVKKWHERWISKKENGNSSKDIKPKESRPTAVHDGLIDLAITSDNKLVFLILDNGRIEPTDRLPGPPEEDDFVPPSKEVLKWKLPRVEKVMEYFRTDNDKKLFDDLVAYHRSISELPSDGYYYLLAIWVFHTYLFDKSEYSPYIWLYAIPERGKTRTGKGCMYVAYRGLHVESLRDAYIIRVVQNLKSALFIDVMNLWRKAERTGTEDVILQRFEKGAVVPRVLYPDRGPHEDTFYYDIYGPTIIATNEKVSEILASRAIQIIMPESDRDFPDDVKPENALSLRERLTAFRARHLNNPLRDTDKPCRGRLGDILRPLRQIVKLVAPDQEQRFLNLCGAIERQRYDTLSETLEAIILQAITDLEHEIENCKLLSKTITEKINEDILEKFHRAQRIITQVCKRMGFRSSRSVGQTYIEINEKLFSQLSLRYLKKSALSALSVQLSENREDFQCSSQCSNSAVTDSSALSALSKKTEKQVHCRTAGNNYKYTDSAQSAVNQSVSGEKRKNTVFEMCENCPAYDKGTALCHGSTYFEGKSSGGMPAVDMVKNCKYRQN